MRIVFFGTPDFAVASLHALLGERLPVLAAITQPDRPRGRSRSAVVPPPVKVVAEEAGIPVYQPNRPLGDVFLTSLRRLEPDIGVVAAYGHILRPEVLQIPRLGMINVHASLLPRHRGAAPIQQAILSGDAETGVTIMQMEAGLDSGSILHRAATPIDVDDTAGELEKRLADLGGTALLETLSLIADGLARPTPQDHALATYAGKIDRAMARIDWEEDAAAVARRIRAFDPVPGAWSMLDGTMVKLFGARARPMAGPTELPDGSASPPGTVLLVGDRLLVACGQGSVLIREVQPEGRRRLPVAAWAQGRGIAAGQRFT